MAASSSPNDILHMPTIKLTASNYPLWRNHMVYILSCQHLLNHVDGSSCAPPSYLVQDSITVNNPAYSYWLAAEQRTIFILHASLSEEVFPVLGGLSTASQIWFALQAAYGNAFIEWVHNLRYQICHIFKGTQSVSEYGYTFKSLCDQLSAIGHPVDKAEQLHWFLNGLGPSFEIFSNAIRACHPSPKFEDLLNRAEKHEFNMIYGASSPPSKAFAARSSQPPYNYMEMARSWNKFDDHSTHFVVPSQREYQQLMQASNVNVSNFVSVKLVGRNNYDIWAAQMICLLGSQILIHIIDSNTPFPADKGDHMIDHYDKLVRGWILGSMNEKLIEEFKYSKWARELWGKLKDRFERRSEYTLIEGSLEFMLSDDTERENSSNTMQGRLYEAAVEGCWWKAKSILKSEKNAATKVITRNGNTILHVAVERGQNHFVEKLLEFLKDDIEDMDVVNEQGQTALHIAAVVSNVYASQLLVQKRKELLEIEDNNRKSPFTIAIYSKRLDLAAYLLRASLGVPSLYRDRLSERNIMLDVSHIIFAALRLKQYDIALEFLLYDTKYISAIGNYLREDKSVLLLLAITFPSDLGFMESCIYPSFQNVRRKTVLRCSLLFHSNFLDTCVEDITRAVKIFNSTCYSWFGKVSMILIVPIATLYPIYQLICLLILVLRLTFSMLYLLLWKVLVVTAPPIKNIEKKKKEYKQAKEILRLIGSDKMSTHEVRQAVLLDAYEVVDEIMFNCPDTIKMVDREEHNIIQFAILNRSEKVYNLLYHIIKRVDAYRDILDPSNNNLAHLAGRLAPSSVLDRTTGAALQLQRELLWRDEVEKLFSPIDLTKVNVDNETPAMVFSREHKDLMKEGESWMKTTAESCSITAALIVTIVFAAAITVPGGSNQDSGVPVFKKEAAFTVFAVSNAFSLFTSTTSLLFFLSILTARFSEEDFLVSLPRRLIFGLLTLFLSTTAMIVSFCAILFLVFCDQRPWMLAPISAFACLPISVIVTIKLPPYW